MDLINYIIIPLGISLGLLVIGVFAFLFGLLCNLSKLDQYGSVLNIAKTYIGGFFVGGWVFILLVGSGCGAAIYVSHLLLPVYNSGNLFTQHAINALLLVVTIGFPALLFWLFKKNITRLANVFGSGNLGVPWCIKYDKFLKDNLIKLNLFVRPRLDKYKVELANKYFLMRIDLLYVNSSFASVYLLNKLTKQEKVFENFLTERRLVLMFEKIFEIVNYETNADELEEMLSSISRMKKKVVEYDKIYLDINEASEAEFTAVPGITIAKAKHIAKVRKEQKIFLSMAQFYEVAGLKEEYIEQIEVQGKKILLSELPEYKITFHKF